LFGGKRGRSKFLALVGYVLLGAVAGALSILVFPHSFIHSDRFHGISLLVTPVLAGLVMSAVGWLREKREQNLIRLDTFGYGAVFAFGFALVRFLFTVPKLPVQ
jgi:H+/Cl- antiporter ClcA